MAHILNYSLTLFLGLAGAAHAFMAGNPAAGRALVATHCLGCHTAPGETAAPADDPAAPGFSDIAVADRTYTLERMRKALEQPHWTDDSVRLTSNNADDVIAFILSLRNE